MSSPTTHQLRWPVRSRLRVVDGLTVATHGVRVRRGRAILTAAGIAIGIASVVAVLGISASNRAGLLAALDELGTNLLVVEPGTRLLGGQAMLPAEAPAMVRRIGPVQQASAVASIDRPVVRSDAHTAVNGLRVMAVEPQMFDTLEAKILVGRFLEHQTATLPTAVIGAVAAERLGIASLNGLPTVSIGGENFALIGILQPMALHPDLDRTIMIGQQTALDVFGFDELPPTRVYLRTDPEQVEAVRDVLAQTANPADPNEVAVSRPSDALEARAVVDQNLQRLLLGLGIVALSVGGIGIANVMVIAVLERKTEIGLRRALGATRTHIAVQFVAESIVIAFLGGLAGMAIGAGLTVGYAHYQAWTVDIPLSILAVGIIGTVVLGGVAGLYPAIRAARLDPAEAVRPR